jgi:regulatory protein YycI of two-component signal transduction system YycFG
MRISMNFKLVSYTQTMLTDLKEMGEGEKTKEQEIITAQTALENLYFTWLLEVDAVRVA